jgi:hypothetical protein
MQKNFNYIEYRNILTSIFEQLKIYFETNNSKCAY